MGWVDESYEHEGYVVYVCADDRRAISGTRTGARIRRPDADIRVRKAHAAGRTPTDEDTHEIIPWTEVTGWQTACDCSTGQGHRVTTMGWLGQIWHRTDTIPYQDDGTDPEDATLPDGTLVEDAARDDWEHHHIAALQPRRELQAAHQAATAAQARLDAAVAQARQADPKMTWEEIAGILKMRRQSAHQRWGHLG